MSPTVHVWARLGLVSAQLGSARVCWTRRGSVWPDPGLVWGRLGLALTGLGLGLPRLGLSQLASARLGPAWLGSARLGPARLCSLRLPNESQCGLWCLPFELWCRPWGPTPAPAPKLLLSTPLVQNAYFWAHPGTGTKFMLGSAGLGSCSSRLVLARLGSSRLGSSRLGSARGGSAWPGLSSARCGWLAARPGRHDSARLGLCWLILAPQ